MKTSILSLTCVAALALSACERPLTNQEKTIVGGLAGIGAGIAASNVTGANKNWTVISTVAAATAGVLIARNNHTAECRYSDGQGGYVVRACPEG